MKDRIKGVLAKVFEVGTDEINETSSPDTVETWESLSHLNMIMALEEEFGVRLTEEQMINMMDFESVVKTVEDAVADNG